MPRNMTLERTMSNLGWEPWNSGGGCVVYRKEKENGYFLISDCGGCNLPAGANERVLIGEYDEEGYEVTPAEEFTTLRECILTMEDFDIDMACKECGTIHADNTIEGYLCDFCYEETQTEPRYTDKEEEDWHKFRSFFGIGDKDGRDEL